ncbi:alpha/beta hydrolase [Phanerochaete sordida]|uniref:Alpha/beta hydrolase n=1 Tax=Phanerochaete sordida TaxID=48140 RepID=A0A9P3LE31_9APHY|nr:alpha/beta hydrolase [Phanerochaete sordida]
MPFAYRTQPWKSLFLAYFLTSVLLVRFPLWLIRSALPPLRPHPSWGFTRSLTLHVLKALGIELPLAVGYPAAPPPPEGAKAREVGCVWVEALEEGAVQGEVGEMAQVNGVRPERRWGYWYGERDEEGGVGQAAREGEKVLYYIHGGAYITGTAHPSAYTSTLIRTTLSACSPAPRAFAIEYRTCASSPYPSANPFPAPLLDALAGYAYLRSLGFAPANIIIAGDSAGGHLAVALTRYLTTASNVKEGALGAPGALLLLSPSLDWALTHEARGRGTLRAHDGTDMVRPIFACGYTARALLGALPATFLAGPWLSPGALALGAGSDSSKGADDDEDVDEGLERFPHTLTIAGGLEGSVDAMRTFHARLARSIGERARYAEYAEAFHDFMLFGWVMEPERCCAVREVGAWLREVYGE